MRRRGSPEPPADPGMDGPADHQGGGLRVAIQDGMQGQQRAHGASYEIRWRLKPVKSEWIELAGSAVSIAAKDATAATVVESKESVMRTG